MSKHTYSEEEEILIIDLYRKLGRKGLTRTNPQVINFCTLLNLYGYDCTIGGVLAKLSNLLSVDPEYKNEGKVGWDNNGSSLKILWNRYLENDFENFDKDVVKAWKTVYAHK